MDFVKSDSPTPARGGASEEYSEKGTSSHDMGKGLLAVPILTLDQIEEPSCNEPGVASPKSSNGNQTDRWHSSQADEGSGRLLQRHTLPCSPRLHPRITFPYGSNELSADTLTYAVKGAISKAQEIYQLQLTGRYVGVSDNGRRSASYDISCVNNNKPAYHNLFHIEPCPHEVGSCIKSIRGPDCYHEATAFGSSKRRIVIVCVENQLPTPATSCVAAVKWFVENIMRPWDIVILLALWEQEDFITKVIEFAREHGHLSPRSLTGSPRSTAGSPRISNGPPVPPNSPVSLVARSPRSSVSTTSGCASPRSNSKPSPMAHILETGRNTHSGNMVNNTAPSGAGTASRVGKWLNHSCSVLEYAYTCFIANSHIGNIDVFPLVIPVPSKGVLSRVSIHRLPASEAICRTAKILQSDIIVIGPSKIHDGAVGSKCRKMLVGSAARDVSDHAHCTVIQVR